MRSKLPDFVEAGRVAGGRIRSARGDSFGAFVLTHPLTMVKLRVIAVADALGWDHVSVSHPKRCPTWSEMAWVKRQFFTDDECVVQFHVPARDHINLHPNCLHLWRYVEGAFPMPPKECV